MNTEDAKKIERQTIEVGRAYTFFSTMQQEYVPQPEERMRTYTGKLVMVIADITDTIDYEEIGERLFKVCAHNGFEFDAYEGELNGWFCDTGQYFWPDATWGPDHDTFALSNEKE
jgi:hypothetical protein